MESVNQYIHLHTFLFVYFNEIYDGVRVKVNYQRNVISKKLMI